MAWLVADEHVLATAEVFDSWPARIRGVLGRDGLDGVVVLRPAKAVHTIGVRFALDVAFCASTDEGHLRVIDTVLMNPNRMGMPRLRASIVIEAEHGSFERWGVHVGDTLQLRE